MKKSIKALLAVLLSIILIFGIATAVNADTEDYTQESSVRYEIAGNFLIYIPMEIVVGDTAQISAVELDIPSNKAVQVTFDDFEYHDYVLLTQAATGETVECRFYDPNSGEIYSNSNNTIGLFRSGAEGTSYDFVAAVEKLNGQSSGTYTGSVNFVISYIDVS